MEKTRCKFYCQSVTKQVGWGNHKFTYSVSFNAVHSDDENSENKKFWDATPGGTVSLQCIYPDLFNVGKEYYVDFTPVG